MILKLMSEENLSDDDMAKSCSIIDYVNEVNYRSTGTGEMALDVQYTKANREATTETFILRANAYLMNDAGKTIQSFASHPGIRSDTAKRKK